MFDFWNAIPVRLLGGHLRLNLAIIIPGKKCPTEVTGRQEWCCERPTWLGANARFGLRLPADFFKLPKVEA